MNILVLNGSPRVNGTTAQMVHAFATGAEESGHVVKIIDVGRKKIAGCMGCEYCHTKGNGHCVQNDDEAEVIEALEDAEMLVLATPIYYYTWSAQLQAAIHRTYAIGIPKKVRQTALLLSSGAPDVYEPSIGQYKSAIVEYFNVKDMGIITVNGMNNRVSDNLEKIAMFGRNI